MGTLLFCGHLTSSSCYIPYKWSFLCHCCTQATQAPAASTMGGVRTSASKTSGHRCSACATLAAPCCPTDGGVPCVWPTVPRTSLSAAPGTASLTSSPATGYQSVPMALMRMRCIVVSEDSFYFFFSNCTFVFLSVIFFIAKEAAQREKKLWKKPTTRCPCIERSSLIHIHLGSEGCLCTSSQFLRVTSSWS